MAAGRVPADRIAKNGLKPRAEARACSLLWCAPVRPTTTAQPARNLLRDQRGAVVIEYLSVAVIGLMTALGLGALVVELKSQYRDALEIVSSEYP